jgi:TusE/DsrC/DsvC family sulfur relay protein
MTLTVNGKTLETDQEGYLLDRNDWDQEVMQALIAEHEAEGHKPLSETAIGLVGYVRESFEEKQTIPTMHELINELGRREGESFTEAQDFKNFLYGMFPHGPIQKLAKLAGLPNPGVENES